MAASGFTPISLYYSTTASAVPVNTNLANGELALNTADMKLYAKNSAGVVTLLASNAATVGVDSLSFGTTGLTPSTGTTGAITVAGTLAVANGGTGQTTYTDGQLLIGNSTGNTLTKTTLTAGTGITVTNGAGAITIASTSSSTLTISNQTAAYTVVSGDAAKVINCSGATSFTVSLTAAATLGSGFNCVIWNNTTTSNMTVTIDPNGAETIDGVASIILRQGEGTQIICDGTNWQTGNKKTMRGYAENYVSTNTRPVAIGSNSVAIGNSYSSGADSFAAAGANNTSSYGAQGANSIAIGRTCTASAQYGIAIGYNCLASNTYGVALGYQATASGTTSFAAGASSSFSERATASNSGSVALGGAYAAGIDSVAIGATAYALETGKIAFSNKKFSTNGDSQYGLFVLRRATTDATATVLTTDNSAASSTNQVILPNNSAYAFTGTVVARRQSSGGTASAAWQITGLIRRESGVGTTVLVNSALTVISNVPAWGLALSADTTNGGLSITFTGAAATNIQAVATIYTTELVYA